MDMLKLSHSQAPATWRKTATFFYTLAISWRGLRTRMLVYVFRYAISRANPRRSKHICMPVCISDATHILMTFFVATNDIKFLLVLSLAAWSPTRMKLKKSFELVNIPKLTWDNPWQKKWEVRMLDFSQYAISLELHSIVYYVSIV